MKFSTNSWYRPYLFFCGGTKHAQIAICRSNSGRRRSRPPGQATLRCKQARYSCSQIVWCFVIPRSEELLLTFRFFRELRRSHLWKEGVGLDAEYA